MSNPYYTHTTYPTPNSPGSSATMRNELENVTLGFDLLPTLAGNGYKVAMVNSAGTALIASAALQGLAVTSSTLNSTVIGGTSAAAGTFTNITASGTVNLGSTVVITGGTINGTSIGGTVQAAGAFTTLSASGGITGNLTGNVTASSGTSAFTNVSVSGTLTATLTGNVTAASGTSTFSSVTINGTLDMDSGSAGTITGLAAPVNDSDAANKGYVDTVAQGLDAKASARAATTANITLSGAQTIDTVSVVAGDRVLVKDQSTASQNGIYVASNTAWSRSSDANTWDELVSAFIFVEEGSANGDNGYVCTINAGGTLGVTAVTWAQFSGAGQITAGNGLTKSGNTLAVGTASSSRIVVNADDIDLAASGVTVGTYKSVTVDAYGRVTGGTNPTTLAGYGITDAYTKTEIDSLFGSTTSAAASAAAAAISASNALTSEGNASTYAGNALTSANNAAASFDSFDDRYLGAKAANPSVDNDGNALLTGALYFNTTVNEMRVYTGSAWLTAYLPATGYVQKSGDTMTGSLAIQTTDNINAVLRITQLGTGNAVLVEDSTNPDSTPFVIDAAGNVGIGTTTASALLNIVGGEVLQQKDSSTVQYTQSAGGTFARLWQRRSSGTNAAPTIVASGDNVGDVLWSGYDGSGYINAASITVSIDGTPGINDMPGRLVFSTTADGASSVTERMRIASTGAIGLAGANYGIAGQVLTSAGSGTTPAWADLAASGPSTGKVYFMGQF